MTSPLLEKRRLRKLRRIIACIILGAGRARRRSLANDRLEQHGIFRTHPGARAICAHDETDALADAQCGKAAAAIADMDKHIIATVVADDESKTTLGREPFNFAFKFSRHFSCSFFEEA
jgi:hypothetical protein